VGSRGRGSYSYLALLWLSTIAFRLFRNADPGLTGAHNLVNSLAVVDKMVSIFVERRILLVIS